MYKINSIQCMISIIATWYFGSQFNLFPQFNTKLEDSAKEIIFYVFLF